MLHSAKNSAILQWFNSLCSYDVASIKQLHDGKLFCDVINSVFHVCFDENKILKDPTEDLKDEKSTEPKEIYPTEDLKDEKSTEPKEISIQTFEGSDECNLITQRYKFLQDFIDGMYHIKSCDLVAFEDCRISNELELAKVAIFILTSVVKHFLESNNEQVNTLTLLDSRVQEDIQECLSILFQNVDKLSKVEMERILSKEATYKVSPLKRSSISTPRRCSSKYKKPIAEEEIFSYSPLKSFLESPQFSNKTFHAKEEELIKTRKILHAEEAKVDDLEFEVDDLRKQIQQKDAEIRNLKNSARGRKSKGRDEKHHGCKKCQDWEERMEFCSKYTKELEDDVQMYKEKVKKLDDYHAQIVSLRTMLEGKRKCQEDSEAERIKLRIDIAYKDSLLQQEQEENKKLREQKQELEIKLQKDESLHDERLVETNLATEKTLDTPVKGEIIGTVIEEENRALHIELDKAKKQIQTLLNELEAKEGSLCHKIHHENSPAKDRSDVSVAELMNGSDISEAKHQNSSKSESVEANCSSLHAGDISSDIIDTNSDQVIGQCSAEENTENVPSSECTVTQAPSEALGSLWANYNDSYSENCEETYCLNNKYGISKSVDLLKQLGFSAAEYTSKINAVNKLCSTLKEVFAPNGSNGFVGLRTLGDLDMKSDEDRLLCLLYIRDSLLKFQNNNSISKDNVFTDKMCNCDSTYAATLNQLKKENDDLTVKLSELNENLVIEMQKKKQELEALVGLKKENEELDAKLSAISAKYKEAMETKVLEIGQLSKELKTTKELYKSALANVTKGEVKVEEMSKENGGLKLKLENVSQKVITLDKNYTKVVNEKNELTEKYHKRVHLLREKTLEFDKVRKELEQAIDYEKRKKMKCRMEYATMEVKFKDFLFKNKELEKNYHDLTKKNKQLTSKIQELESFIAKKAGEDVAENFPYHAVTHSTVLNEDRTGIKEGNANETGELNMPKTEISDPEISTASQFGDNPKDVKPHDLSTHSGALFSRHSFILPTDDEESYLNHSSIAEINSGKKLRLKELQRRNSIVPPHMRSSYAPEVQCISPFNRNLFDLVKTHLDNKDSNKIKKNLFSVKKVKPSVLTSSKKKRKVSELESDNEVNFSKGPDSWKRRMRNQSNFMKVLYRKSQDCKPNQQL